MKLWKIVVPAALAVASLGVVGSPAKADFQPCRPTGSTDPVFYTGQYGWYGVDCDPRQQGAQASTHVMVFSDRPAVGAGAAGYHPTASSKPVGATVYVGPGYGAEVCAGYYSQPCTLLP